MTVVEQHTHAHIITEEPESEREFHGSVPVMLLYDPEDPGTVRIRLPGAKGPREYALSRALLEKGLRTPAEAGDIQVWPSGRVHEVVEFHSDKGAKVVEFDCKALLRFLRRTYTATASAPASHASA